jgi:hypothetical protein
VCPNSLSAYETNFPCALAQQREFFNSTPINSVSKKLHPYTCPTCFRQRDDTFTFFWRNVRGVLTPGPGTGTLDCRLNYWYHVVTVSDTLRSILGYDTHHPSSEQNETRRIGDSGQPAGAAALGPGGPARPGPGLSASSTRTLSPNPTRRCQSRHTVCGNLAAQPKLSLIGGC